MAGFLRPNAITIKRFVDGAVSLTGVPSRSLVTIGENVPAMLDVYSPTIMGQMRAAMEGVTEEVTHVCFLDALGGYYVGNDPPGTVIPFKGVDYIVGPDGGAFVDLKPGDAIVDEMGANYMCIGVFAYVLVRPTMQALFALGRSQAQ